MYNKKGNKHKVHVQSFEFYYFYTGNSLICDLGQGEIIWNLSLTDYRSLNSFQEENDKYNTFGAIQHPYFLCSLHKKWSFLLGISSVNATKSAVNGRFGHIYWRNP